MLLSKSNRNTWSKRDIQIIAKYRQRVKDIEELNLQNKILHKDINSIDFYKITPKEQLPKFLQKMKFQTLHSKQNVAKVVKVFRKERDTVQQSGIRKKLKEQGQIMFLSEIYQNLGQPLQAKTSLQLLQNTKFLETYGGDLEEWQKTKNNALMQKLMVMKKRHPHHQSSPRHRQSRIIEQKLSQLHRKNSSGRIVNYFKEGSNYKKQIQKQLDIIYFTHSSEQNQVNKYILIENSSKLLKKQLDQRKLQVEEQIKSKLKILNETRIQHHNLFQQKSRLIMQEKQYSQELSSKQQYGLTGGSQYFASSTTNKLTELKTQKRHHIQQNQIKIMKNKRLIEQLQNAIQNCEDQIRSIMIGQISYYKMSLKIGMDCRDSGLGWILKKLRQLINGDKNTPNNNHATQGTNTSANATKQQEYEFPLYLDKKSKEFLIIKTQLQDQLQQLMEQKRKFVNQIGQSGSGQQTSNPNPKALMNRTMGSTVGSGWTGPQDKIIQDGDNNTSDIPKKYRQSLRKITILNQQYAKNHSLLDFKARRQLPSKGVQLSNNTDGLSGKKLYQTISQKIKFFDFTKTKKDKTLQLKNSKLLEYQNLLNLIKQIHIKIEDSDIQHQNHLINHYKQNKQTFFIQCAACFGYKKSYSMIIKYFSWKNGTDVDAGNV